MSYTWAKPITLEGRAVRIEPLLAEHADSLFTAGSDERVWRNLSWPPFRSPADSLRYIEDALAKARDGSQIPFAIVSKSSGEVAGSTRYLEIRPEHRGLEIGWTWLGVPWQRTAINTECKLLLLQHAFEELRAIRVELKTDIRNQQSQRAIERLGARREGVTRNHRIRPDGTYRDSVVYSIIDLEWPKVKEGLHAKLLRNGSDRE